MCLKNVPNVYTKLFRRKKSSLLVNRIEASQDSEKNSAHDASGDGSDDSRALQVWIYPDTPELKKQTLMRPRQIHGPVFTIGRRKSSSTINSMESLPDLCINDQQPYSVSRNHCQIELRSGRVFLKDLDSRIGTRLGDKRLGGGSSFSVGVGEHKLILGRQSKGYCFRLVVSE
ncbi:MAG: FHA domain-containing protein [Verrucomicrobiota bacterium]